MNCFQFINVINFILGFHLILTHNLVDFWQFSKKSYIRPNGVLKRSEDLRIESFLGMLNFCGHHTRLTSTLVIFISGGTFRVRFTLIPLLKQQRSFKKTSEGKRARSNLRGQGGVFMKFLSKLIL